MEATTIRELFDSRNRRFVIPPYQRAYSWEHRQLKQFIEDLKEAGNKYYLGHFLFEQQDTILHIIDGQQRLTTCVIFFSTLIDILKKREDISTEYLEDIEDYYLKDLRKKTQKFETVIYDNNFFADLIIDRNDSFFEEELSCKSQKAIYEAKVYFKKEFENTPTPELKRWCDLVENAAITLFVVDNKIQAAQIFAFQNDRGKKLSNLEVLKSYFILQIYMSPDDAQKQEDNIRYLENYFKEIYQTIVSIDTNEDSVLNYYWRAIGPTGFNSENVLKEIKEYFSKYSSYERGEKIKNFIKRLSQSFKIIQSIEKERDLPDLVNLKNLNNMALSYPILIKAKLHNITDKTFTRVIRLMENITFRSLLRGGRADIESRINGFLKKSNSDDTFDKGINHVIQQIKHDGWWGYWNDAEVLRHLNSGYFYNNRVDNYVLWRYEQYLCNKNYPKTKITYEQVIRNESIEHIAPRTQPDENPKIKGYGIYDDPVHPENGIVSGRWMNCIGNLMLMAQSQNSSLSNRPFSDKLKVYGKDNLLNQQKEIIEFIDDRSNPIWDKSCIEKRHNKILEAAKNIWNLDNI